MLEELRARFRNRFIDTARDRIRRCLTMLSESGRAMELASELHSLAGEAAMLGLDSISVTARSGEDAARQWNAASTAAQVACARAVRTLRQQVEAFAAEPVAGETASPDARTPSNDPAAGLVNAPASGPSNAPARQRILVVDDSPLAGEELADSLGRAGFEVRVAADRDGAVREIHGFAPALVLTDVQMPGVTPVSLCDALRAATSRPLKILLMSGRTDDELAIVARATRADGFVSKQHGTEHIVAHVRRAVQEAAP
jgi:CheY-like chemotaxis protein/HPt (histidine-containing phosphotransfer) domain-containing protein